MDEGALIPIHVARIDADTHLKEFVGNQRIGAVVKGVFHETLEVGVFCRVVKGHQHVEDLARKHIHVRIKAERRLEVEGTGVRGSGSRNTVVAHVVGVKEIVGGVDTDLHEGTGACDTVGHGEATVVCGIKTRHEGRRGDGNIFNDDELRCGRFGRLGDVVTIATDEDRHTVSCLSRTNGGVSASIPFIDLTSHAHIIHFLFLFLLKRGMRLCLSSCGGGNGGALLLLNEGALIPIHVVRVDGYAQFKEFVCNQRIGAVVKGVFHECGDDFRIGGGSGRALRIQDLEDLTGENIHVGVKVKGLQQVVRSTACGGGSTGVRRCKTGDTHLVGHVRVLEIVRGVDTDLNRTAEVRGASNIFNDDELRCGRFGRLGDVVADTADENIVFGACGYIFRLIVHATTEG